MVDSPETRPTPAPAVAGTDPVAEEAADLVSIEAEDGTDGSTMDEVISQASSTFTASLASGAVDYPVEYGRRYHAFRPGGSYISRLALDFTEMDRLDMAHTLMVRILDVGTGTGIWSMEMGDIFQQAEIIGNDLSAIQPPWVPPNVKFEIDDVESTWLHNEKFDYIFLRYMLVSINNWPKLVKNIYKLPLVPNRNLNPGGWVEFHEVDGEYYSDDGTYTKKHTVRQWNIQYVEACEMMGRTARPGPQLEGWVKDAGFQNITHQRFKIPIGPWAKENHYRDIGMLNLAQLLNGLEGFTLKLFCGFLGQTREEVLVLLAKVREELKSSLFHAMLDFHVVYAQKPFEEEPETA
ncbi:methyltransferase domain-containing protein [Colletotrichum cereale]|nr:methyltransferase domain-containing protein [Colletotrichum cereale]